jgi:hypothetical protein
MTDNRKKNRNAVALAKLRAELSTPEERTEWARNAAICRWNKEQQLTEKV